MSSYQQTVDIEALAAVYSSCHFTVTSISDIYHPVLKGIPKIENPLPNYSSSDWWVVALPPFGPGVPFEVTLSLLTATF